MELKQINQNKFEVKVNGETYGFVTYNPFDNNWLHSGNRFTGKGFPSVQSAAEALMVFIEERLTTP